MHPQFQRGSELTGTIIAAGIEVHKTFAPGLLESVYHWALTEELTLRQLKFSTEQRVRIEYKGSVREDALRYDVLVEGAVLVEVKAVESVRSVHKAQLLTYMKLLNVPLGLILDFHETRLVDGVSRLILPRVNL